MASVEADFWSNNLELISSKNHIRLMSSNLPPNPGFDFQQQQQWLMQGMGMQFECQRGHGSSSSPCSSSSSTTTVKSLARTSMSLSPPFAALLERQGRELDLLLHLQGDKLRQMLHQQIRQEIALVLSNFESKIMFLVSEKEDELQKLRMKTKMLEDYLRKTEVETEAWQRVAMEQEETVISLSNMLEQVKANLSLVPQPNQNTSPADNDEESVCDCDSRGKAGAEEERENEEMMKKKKKFGCKWCNSQYPCVVFLPCKHLCCCKSCDALLELCPICHSVKQGSVEVFFS